jgi:hypothetical protein
MNMVASSASSAWRISISMATGIVTAVTLCTLTTAMAWSQPYSSAARRMRMKPTSTVYHSVAGHLQQRTPTALYHAHNENAASREDLTSIHGESDESQLRLYRNRAQVLQHLVQSQQGELRKYQTRCELLQHQLVRLSQKQSLEQETQKENAVKFQQEEEEKQQQLIKQTHILGEEQQERLKRQSEELTALQQNQKKLMKQQQLDMNEKQEELERVQRRVQVLQHVLKAQNETKNAVAVVEAETKSKHHRRRPMGERRRMKWRVRQIVEIDAGVDDNGKSILMGQNDEGVNLTLKATNSMSDIALPAAPVDLYSGDGSTVAFVPVARATQEAEEIKKLSEQQMEIARAAVQAAEEREDRLLTEKDELIEEVRGWNRRFQQLQQSSRTHIEALQEKGEEMQSQVDSYTSNAMDWKVTEESFKQHIQNLQEDQRSMQRRGQQKEKGCNIQRLQILSEKKNGQMELERRLEQEMIMNQREMNHVRSQLAAAEQSSYSVAPSSGTSGITHEPLQPKQAFTPTQSDNQGGRLRRVWKRVRLPRSWSKLIDHWVGAY